VQQTIRKYQCYYSVHNEHLTCRVQEGVTHHFAGNPSKYNNKTMKKIYETLNRALIKRMELLPNISEFKTEKIGIHEYAAIYEIEKILRRTKATKLIKSQPNFYLERQYKRLTTYAANGQVAEFNHLSRIVLSKSMCFRILALNRTQEDWFILPIRKLRRLWNSLNFISSTLSSDLKFKRVWIDKKEGDYARPLGVPTPAWRCYSFMWMDHIERFYKAGGYLQPWQHGGRSGVGVLSCYKQLIPRLKESNTVFEFDIKGFFDNISHEVIIKRFKETLGNTTAEWIASILATKPIKYILPPEEKDIGFQSYKELPDLAMYDDFGPIDPETLEHHLNLMRTYPATDKLPEEWGYPLPEDIWTPEEEEAIKKAHREYEKKTIGEVYKPLQEGKTVEVTRSFYGDNQIVNYEDPSYHDRAIARDAWKNLGQPGKGVPQGLGTSPFISTFLTDTHLYELGTDHKALIMYMDDGILFADSKDQMEKYIKRLKELLSSMGLEIAPEKSKYSKINGVWQDSIRFLGLRYIPEKDTFTSETRSGTRMEFPARGDWEDIKNLAALNHTNISGVKEKFDRLINTQAYEAGLKYGFLGCLIAGSQYKEALPMEERKEEIRKGQASAWAAIERSKKGSKQGFLWKHQDLVHYAEYLTNVSSIACHNFAEFNRKGRKLFCQKRPRAFGGKNSRK